MATLKDLIDDRKGRQATDELAISRFAEVDDTRRAALAAKNDADAALATSDGLLKSAMPDNTPFIVDNTEIAIKIDGVVQFISLVDPVTVDVPDPIPAPESAPVPEPTPTPEPAPESTPIPEPVPFPA